MGVCVEAADGGRREAARVGHGEGVGETLSRGANFLHATFLKKKFIILTPDPWKDLIYRSLEH